MAETERRLLCGAALLLIVCGFISPPTSAAQPILNELEFTFSVPQWGDYEGTVYYVDGRPPAPTVMFMHGYAAKKDYYDWIYKTLNADGFAVVAWNTPSHLTIGSLISLLPDVLSGRSIAEEFFELVPFQQWLDGVTPCIDKMTTDPRLVSIINPDKIAVMGHSGGGVASLLVSGREDYVAQNPSSEDQSITIKPDKRIKAAVSLAGGFKSGEIVTRMQTQFDVPIQIIIGTRDLGFTIPEQQTYLSSVAAPKKDLVIIEGANHMGFMDEDIVNAIDLMRPLLGDFFTMFDQPATISLEDQHRQSSEAFIPFLHESLMTGGQSATIAYAAFAIVIMAGAALAFYLKRRSRKVSQNSQQQGPQMMTGRHPQTLVNLVPESLRPCSLRAW